VSGKLVVNADVVGSLQAPKMHLLAQLDQAAAHLIPYNLDLKNILIKLEGWSNEALKLTGSLISDQGRLGLTGNINNVLSDPSLLLHLKGENILLADLPSYKVWASPAIDMTLTSSQFSLKGNLFIPKAQLQFADYENKVVTLTDDVVYEDEAQKHFGFSSNIFLQLGDNVSLRYGGLTGQLKGKLQLQQTTDAPATAIGAIQLVNGKYKAYGQSLAIQKGLASFKGGNVDNPVLDVKAVKVLQNVTPLTLDGAMAPGGSLVGPDGSLTVGVSIAGPLAQRKTELFSIPAGLSQSDILSYLVLGVPASQAGSGGGQLLLSAASSLSDGKSGGAISQLQEQLKNSLGIEVGVGTVSQYNPTTQAVTEGTALILTKSLSPKLFFTYSAGTGQTVSVFKIRYQITPRWMAQTESSSLGNGGDIYYMINRD
jgi:translocation and assembly module TamB